MFCLDGRRSDLIGGDWNMTFIFHILGIVIPIDSYLSDGLTPPTRYISFLKDLGIQLCRADGLSHVPTIPAYLTIRIPTERRRNLVLDIYIYIYVILYIAYVLYIICTIHIVIHIIYILYRVCILSILHIVCYILCIIYIIYHISYVIL